MKFKEKKTTEWEITAKDWARFKPPYKPGKERIKLYRKFLLKYSKGKNILVLGATPEIRDILAEENCNVTLVDQSSDVIKAMSNLRKTKSKEKIIISNWLKFKPREKYDVIYGDCVLNNIHQINWLKLENLVASWLSKNGVFITEIAGFFKTNFPKYDYIDVINKYRRNPDFFKDFANKTLVHYYLWWKYKKPSGWIPIYKIDLKFKELYRKGKIKKKEFDNIRLPLTWSGTMLLGNEIRAKLKEVFDILEEVVEDKHPVYNYFYRLYVLKPKN